MTKKIYFILIILNFYQILSAQENNFITGNLAIDLFQNLPKTSLDYSSFQEESKNYKKNFKSPFLAGGMSLLVPGAGEFYAQSYIKSGLFLGIEIAAWVYYIKYDKKGDNQTLFFQNFADERIDQKPNWDTNEPDRYRTRWDVIRYYEWSFNNKSIINPQGDYSNISNAIVNNDQSLPPWERVDWERLNALERAIGKWYSHTLHHHGEQQYYELIGKYPQYNQGWFDADNPDFQYGDQLSSTFKEYSRMRGIANDYYYKAKTAVTIVLLNHVISAIDAYFTTRGFNSRLKIEARYENQQTYFGLIPLTFGKIKYEF